MRNAFLSVCLLVILPAAALAQKKEVQELQRDVFLLQDQVRTLQRSIDERFGSLTTLVQQSIDAGNKANTALAVLESGLRDRVREQIAPVSGVGLKIDAMSQEFVAVKESINDLNARMGKLQAQLVDMS